MVCFFGELNTMLYIQDKDNIIIYKYKISDLKYLLCYNKFLRRKKRKRIIVSYKKVKMKHEMAIL